MPMGDREILKADPEDGHTPIANLLLEAIAISTLTGKKKGILLLLCRKTYGWQRDGQRLKETALSIGDCAKALNIDRRTAHKLLTDLANDKIISRGFSKPGFGYTIAINTRVGEWTDSCINHQLLEKLSGDGLVKNTTVGLAKTPTPPIAKLGVPKESKRNLNKEIDKNIDNDIPDFARKLGYGKGDLPTLEEAEYNLTKPRLLK